MSEHTNHVCEGCGVYHMHYLLMIQGKWWCDTCEEWHDKNQTCSTKLVRDSRNSRTEKLASGDYD